MNRFLIDTYVLLFMIQNPRRLRASTRTLLEDPANQLFLSLASCWEIAIKVGVGKLRLPEPAEVFIPRTLNTNRIDLLQISLEHVLAVAGLPRHHGDPFDRLLIAQALAEDIPLISADPHMARYPVRIIAA